MGESSKAGANNTGGFKAFLKKKDIEFSWKRYFIDAMGAMASGLFASLLIGTILSTIGTQFNLSVLTDMGGYAKGVAGPAMAVAIAYALKAPNLVLFSMLAVGSAANTLGGAGGPQLVFVQRSEGSGEAVLFVHPAFPPFVRFRTAVGRAPFRSAFWRPFRLPP